MTAQQQYPRLMTTAVANFGFTVWRGRLYRVYGPGDKFELATCQHNHRRRHKALECAERLAIADGAPEV